MRNRKWPKFSRGLAFTSRLLSFTGSLTKAILQGPTIVLQWVREPECLANDRASGETAIFIANSTGYSTNFMDDEGNAKVILAPYGTWDHRRGMQVFDRKSAEAIVNDFSSITSKIRNFFGLPWYIGHPDDAAWHKQFPFFDDRSYGRIKSLEATDEGLLANVKFNDRGIETVKNQEYHGHSVRWLVKTENGRKIPFSLKSVGFTNQNNIPVEPILSNSTRSDQVKELCDEHREAISNAGTRAGALKGWATRRAKGMAAAKASGEAVKKKKIKPASKNVKDAAAKVRKKRTKLKGVQTPLTPAERFASRESPTHKRKSAAMPKLKRSKLAGSVPKPPTKAQVAKAKRADANRKFLQNNPAMRTKDFDRNERVAAIKSKARKRKNAPAPPKLKLPPKPPSRPAPPPKSRLKLPPRQPAPTRGTPRVKAPPPPPKKKSTRK